MAEQRRANARALELDSDNDLALIARAVASRNFNGDPEAALPIEEAVLWRSPNFGPAHYSVAASLWMRGRTREALEHMDQAIDRDPFDTYMRYYRIGMLNSLGDYEAVRDAVRQCPPCSLAGWGWVMSMAGFATPAEFRQDIPLLAERASAEGIPPEAFAQGSRIIEALVLGRPFAPPPPENEERISFVQAAINARLVSFERGLRYAHIAADVQQPDSVLEILNEGRMTFTPEQRADPRYHQLFRHPKLVKIAAVRRREGITAGLPAFPIKPYRGR